MGKKKHKKNVENKKEEKLSILEKIQPKQGYITIGILIFLILVIFYNPIIFQGLSPVGRDTIAGIGKMHQLREYTENSGDQYLWNPNIFCGMPEYFSINSKAFNIDRLIGMISRSFLNWRISWFILGAIGMFFLFHILGFPWYISAVGVIAFLFLPHFQGLLNVGHNTKIRAICSLPWVIYGFINFTKKRDLLSIALFTIFFSLHFRTKHFQIIFYTLLILLTIGIYTIINWIKENELQRLYKTLGMFVGALIIAILMTAQPLFVTNEYTPYSTRGGKAIELPETQKEETVAKKTSGVSFKYATRWSYSPKELMTLISPRFFGGTSSEEYNGNNYPRRKGRRLPTYWGDMPFTQSSEYLGIIIVILGIAGIWFYRKDKFIISLTILLFFSLLLSFGHHFPPLYKLLFYNLPYFSKFRVPMMILVLISFIMIILAMYGLKGLVNNYDLKKFKAILYISAFFAAIGLLPVIFPGMMSFTGGNDYQYKPQFIPILKNIRMEYMRIDTLRMLLFIILFIGLIVLFQKEQIKKSILILGIFGLIAFDMISVSNRCMNRNQLRNKEQVERQYFKITKYDQIIGEDKGFYRVMGFRPYFKSNDLAYRHQLVGGYSAIKPQLIQDIVDNNLYKASTPTCINWNILNMLNAKYIISPAFIPYEGLTLLEGKKDSKNLLFKNQNALPRAFLVKEVKQLPDETEVVGFMNKAEFDPGKIAITSDTTKIEANYDIDRNIKITNYTPNKIELSISDGEKSFLILSESYFPIGWRAFVDEDQKHIFQINHILRGIEVPAGTHDIIFEFKPKSYSRASMISSITTYLVWTIILILLIIRYKSAFTLLKSKLKK